MQTPLQLQGLIRARGCTAIVGHRDVFGLASWLIAQVLLTEPQAQVMCVDGANRFDVLTLARLSRTAGAVPKDWLQRVLVSRAYSGDQLLGVLLDRAIPQFSQAAPRMCVALGWLESLYDEDVNETRARAWLQAVVDSIKDLKQRTHLVLFESSFLEVSGPRQDFIHQVLSEVDEVLNWTPDGRLYG